MKKLEIITGSEKLEPLAKAFDMLGHNGMIILKVEGYGRQKGIKEKKVKIEIVFQDDKIEKAVEMVILITRTGHTGNGKMFISRIDKIIKS